jgi:hypothetical protein
VPPTPSPPQGGTTPPLAAASQLQLGSWEVAADGGVLNFGDAAFYGSMAKRHLAAPVVGT